jgi:hypothetical protein
MDSANVALSLRERAKSACANMQQKKRSSKSRSMIRKRITSRIRSRNKTVKKWSASYS